MCVNPESKRPYTVSAIMRSLKEVHFSVNVKKSAKLQALKCIDKLKKVMPIERAQMRLLLSVPAKGARELLGKVKDMEDAVVVREAWGDTTLQVEVLVLPGLFRTLHELVQEATRGGLACTAVCGGRARIVGPPHCGLTPVACTRAGKGSVEVLEAHVQTTGEAKLEEEAVRLDNMRGPEAGTGGGAGDAGAGEGGAASAGADASTAADASEAVDTGAGAGRDTTGDSAGAGGGGGQRGGGRRRGAKGGKRGGKAKRAIKCGTCKVEFGDAQDHRNHCKSDWHRLNLKRKLKGEAPVPEAEFEAMDTAALTDFFAQL